MRRRPGLTLVEMLVSLALSVFMMAILSEAFVTGLKAFGQLKALADMEQQLRTAATILRRDLKAPHFEGNRKLSQLTVSGQPIPGNVPAGAVWNMVNPPLSNGPGGARNLHPNSPYRSVPPELGFLRIEENNFSVQEAVNPTDPLGDSLDPTIGAGYRDYDDVLHMTVRFTGRGTEEVFRGESARAVKMPGFVPPPAGGRLLGGEALDDIGFPISRYDLPGNNQFVSNWAEVLYFTRVDTFRPNNPSYNFTNAQFSHAIPGGTTMFNLYRREMLLLPDAQTMDQTIVTTTSPVVLPTPNIPNAFPQIFWQHFDVSACWLDPNNPTAPITGAGIAGNNRGWYFNSPADVQFPARRYNFRVQPGDPQYDAGSVANNVSYLPRFQAGLGVKEGSDLLLANVISFDIKVWDPLARKFVDIGYSDPFPFLGSGAANPDFGIFWGDKNLVTPPRGINRIYETGTNRTAVSADGTVVFPPQAPTHAVPFSTIQVKIRVYDPKTKQTREATIQVDM